VEQNTDQNIVFKMVLKKGLNPPSDIILWTAFKHPLM